MRKADQVSQVRVGVMLSEFVDDVEEDFLGDSVQLTPLDVLESGGPWGPWRWIHGVGVCWQEVNRGRFRGLVAFLVDVERMGSTFLC